MSDYVLGFQRVTWPYENCFKLAWNQTEDTSILSLAQQPGSFPVM